MKNMKIVALIKELRENNVVVNLAGDQLELVILGKEDVDPELLERLKKQKQEVVNYLELISTKNDFVEIQKAGKSDSYPVSNAQFRIWFESQSEDASRAYHMPFEIHLTGPHNIPVLEKAIQHVISRHEILRTVFKLDNNKELRQYIIPEKEVCFEIDYQDFSRKPGAKKQAQSYIKALLSIPFDLEQGPLMKVSVLRYQTESYIFFCNLHHSICDAWSISVLKQEILLTYESLCDDKLPVLPELRIQYKDYASWHVKKLENESLILQKEYWLNQFRGEIPVLEFPMKNTRPPIKTYNGRVLKTYFGKELTERIHSYQSREGGSLFMVILSSLYVMLSRYTAADDIVIGSPFAAREHIDLKNQIGFYTNTLAIRNRLEKTDTFDSFFSKVKQSVLEAYHHQQYPFDRLVEELKLKKDLSRNPLFDAMLVVLPNDTMEGESKPQQEVDAIVCGNNTTSKFDFLFYVEEVGENLSFKIEYNTDLYEEALIRQFICHYKKMLDLLLTEPQKEIVTINYLPEDGEYNTEIDHSKYKTQTVVALFEKQVVKTPDAIAVCYEDHILTYKEVNEYANQIASYLKSQHPQITKTNIGVLLGRSHFNVITMLGLIKSGACYVPIDAKYSESRKQYIIDDAGITSIISTTDVCEVSSIGQAKITHLDTFKFSEWGIENTAVVNSLDDAAFIIYTSGSTGKPKGVIQTHRMLSNLIQWNIYDAGINSGLKHLQYTSFSFDVSLQDCWFVLSSGGTLYVTPESMKIDFHKLSLYIVGNSIEVLSFPFSALSNFFKSVSEQFTKEHKLKHIISSGEQLTIDKAMEIFLLESPKVKLHNHYGPSETHVVTSYTLSAEENELIKYVPIGKPVANTKIYLFDQNFQPVPENIIGEIYVGGENLARGYVNLPQLTEERFISNPFNKEEKLYKTGDLGYKNTKGIITYLGRNDNQVKIRGYRIELAEIKNVILSKEGINQAYVDVVNIKNEKAIVAYISGKESFDRQSLKRELSKQLPEYMIPSYIVFVDNIPLTSNGKIDKKKLPEVTEEALVRATYVAPQTKTEKELVLVWEKLLGVSSIGVTDDFFELGGHSLHITRMLHDINKIFDIKIQIKDIFSSQNILELSRLIDDELIFKKGIAINQTEQINKKSEVWEI